MKRMTHPRTIGSVGLAVCVWLVWPAQALGRALIRFIQALPGVGSVTVSVGAGGHGERVGSLGFGQVSGWHSLRSGHFTWSLVSGDKRFARGTATIGHGAYDLVLLAEQPLRVGLGVYRAQAGRPGASLIRVIHAAPELGAPELKLDASLLAAGLDYTHATSYTAAVPGTHALLALAGPDAAPLVPGGRLRLTRGRSYSAILIGSRGARLRWVTVTDRGAPLTRPHPGRRRPAAHPRTPEPSVVVGPGDSLWTIAAAHVGADAGAAEVWSEVVAIWRLNAARIGTGDPNLIFPGQRLLLPRRHE